MRTTTVRVAITAALTISASAAIPMTAPQDMRFERVWEGRNILDAALPFPDGVTFVPGAEYRADVKSQPAGMRIVNEKCDTLAYFAAPTNVMPPFTMHVAVTGICRPAIFVTKDGKTTLAHIANLPKEFDPRHQKFMRTLSVKPDGGAGDVEARLSAGVGQADVRFVTRGREGRPYIEDGRLYFTFSVRFYAALTGVGSIDAAHPECGVRTDAAGPRSRSFLTAIRTNTSFSRWTA